MKKIFSYFVSGILPIGLISLSPYLWRSGFAVLEKNTPFIFLIGMIGVTASWAIAAHHIHLGYLTLENISKIMRTNRCRVRLVSINLPGIQEVSDPVTLYYFEKKRFSPLSSKWSTVKNFEIFPNLANSNSLAYFRTKESALEKLQIIQRGKWIQNTQFDPVYIESEYIAI
jgi:hypothetical protein